MTGNWWQIKLLLQLQTIRLKKGKCYNNLHLLTHVTFVSTNILCNRINKNTFLRAIIVMELYVNHVR